MTVSISHRHPPIVIQEQLLQRVTPHHVPIRHYGGDIVMDEIPIQTVHVAEDCCRGDHDVDCDVTAQ